MNGREELWLRAAVVSAGTATAAFMAMAAIAVLPFRGAERPLAQQRVVEAGIVELPLPPAARAAPHPRARNSPPPMQPPPAAAPAAPPRPVPEGPMPAPSLPAVKPEIPDPPATQAAAGPSAPQPASAVAPSPPQQAAPAPAPPGTAQAKGSGFAGGTSAARALYQPSPVIPPELRRHALDAVAVVRITIGSDGRPTVELVEATPDLEINELLLGTFRRWRFFPATRQGKPVPSTLVLRIPIKVE